jgi:hypothetical protein
MELETVLEIESLRYLAQDETRMGQSRTETKRVITSGGVKPKVKLQWPREAFWLYKVVEPLTGWQWTQEESKLNSENFQSFRWRPFHTVRFNSSSNADRTSTGASSASTGMAREHYSHFSTCSLSRTQFD